MKLTKTDKMILESYEVMIEGLAAYLGSAYEISLHSLEDYDHSVIKIMNGYHSGRSAGAPLTDLAMNMLKRISDEGISAAASYSSYFAVNHMGDHLKSTTIPVLGEKQRLIGLVCINCYLDTPLSEILSGLTEQAETHVQEENFHSNMEDTLLQTVSDTRTQIMQDKSISASNKNREIIRLLWQKGIFRIKDAVPQAASALGISKNTVYMHLREMRKEENAKK